MSDGTRLPSNDGKLYFQFVTIDDAGDYYCVVKRPNTMDSFQEGKTSMPIPLQVIETGKRVSSTTGQGNCKYSNSTPDPG